MSEFGTNDASHELIPLYMYALTLPTKDPENAAPLGPLALAFAVVLGVRLRLRSTWLRSSPPRSGAFAPLTARTGTESPFLLTVAAM